MQTLTLFQTKIGQDISFSKGMGDSLDWNSEGIGEGRGGGGGGGVLRIGILEGGGGGGGISVLDFQMGKSLSRYSVLHTNTDIYM